MKFVETISDGVHLLQVDSWISRGIFHGFADRTLPVSEAPSRWPSLTASMGNSARLRLLRQTHSKKIITLTEGFGLDPVQEIEAEGDSWIADGRVSDCAQVALGIKTADCFPVLVASTTVPLVASVHCGWRGTESGLLLDTLVLLGRMGAPARSLEVVIGPGAQACSYEIGLDVSKLLQRSMSFVQALSLSPVGPVVESRDGKLFANLVNLLSAQAGFFGVRPESILVATQDTITDDRFFSHRREKEGAGRQISFIAAPTA